MDPSQSPAPYGEYGASAPAHVPMQTGPAYGQYSGYGGYPREMYIPNTSYYKGGGGYEYSSGYSYYGGNTNEFLSPRRLIKVLRRRWLLILLMMVVGMVAAILYFWRAERVFRSRALIEMNVRGPRILNEVVQQDFGKSEEVFNTRLGRLRGTRFDALASERFVALWETFGRPLPRDEQPQFGSVSYNMVRGSRLVQIFGEANHPLVAAISANAAAEAAEEFFELENRDLSNGAVEWLNRSAGVQRTQLETTEAALLAFRSENKLDTLRAQQEADRQALLTLNDIRITQENKLLRTQEFLRAVDEVTLDLEDGIEIPGTVPNRDAILELVKQYRGALDTREEMLEIKTEKHPDVLALDLKILNLSDNIQREINFSKSSLKQEYRIISGQLKAVSKRIEEVTKTVSDQELNIVELNSTLNTLLDERNVAKDALNAVLKQIEQARLAADEDTATLRLVERAIVTEKPVHPKMAMILPFGLAGGLAIGFALALILEAVEDRIFSIAELEAEISSRIIGIIPHIPNGKRADLAMISLNQKFGQVAEAFNAVRVILDHVNNNRLRENREKGYSHPGGHVIMFCSASPSEGKTVSSTNVAITSARAGQKTLLIDCDMRRPCLAKVFEDAIEEMDVEDGTQFSLLHHLASEGGQNFEKIILPGPTKNLDLMASLASSEINPADLLGGRDIQNLISWARKNYDRVIVDTPPIGLISDGMVISNLADGVVAVCRAGQTRHRALRHVLLQFKGVGANVIGIIVNDFNMKKAAEPMDVHYRDFATGYERSVYKELEKEEAEAIALAAAVPPPEHGLAAPPEEPPTESPEDKA